MFAKTNFVQGKLKNILNMMLPIFITQAAIMSMGVADTIMSGHAGVAQLAGVAIANNIWMPIFTGLNGILMALTPIVAHLLGAGKKDALGTSFWNGLYLSLFISAGVIFAGYLFLDSILTALYLEPAVYAVAKGYLIAVAFGIPPFFANILFRSIIDTTGNPRLTMKLFLITVPVNICLNYIFIFGKFGLPAMGGIGAGIGTSITCWLMSLSFILLTTKIPVLHAMRLDIRQAFDSKIIKELLRIGVPSGLAIVAETSIWGFVGLYMSKFGTETIAAHETAINFEGLLFMLPLSFSMALTILVGIEVGAKRYEEAVSYAKVGIRTALTMALCFVVLLLTCRGAIATLYGAQGNTFTLAKGFLFYAAFFQLLDGTATPIQGILRGYKDVRFGFFASIFAYWVICPPLGYILDVYFGHGATSYWQALVCGIFFSALLQGGRLLHVQKKYRNWHK